MRKFLPALLLTLAACWGVWHLAHDVADHPAVGDGRLRPVAPGVLVHRAFATNAGVVVTGESLLLVDAHASRQGGVTLEREVARLSPYPVTHLMLTGASPLHGAGAAAFPDVELVATDRAAAAIERAAPDALVTLGLPTRERTSVPGPTRRVGDREALELSGVRVELRDVSTAQAPGATLVWLPEKRVLFAGDVLTTHGLPWTGEPLSDTAIDAEGSWKEALDVIRAWRPEVLVPAHGPVLVGEQVIAERVDLVTRVLDAAASAARAAGVAPVEEALPTMLATLAPVLDPLKLDESLLSRRQLALAMLASTRDSGWRSLEPHPVPRVARGDALKVLDGADTQVALLRARDLVADRDVPLAVSVLEEQLQRTPNAAHFNGLLADMLMTHVLATDTAADAAAAASRALEAARRELALTAREPLASLTLGCLSTWGAAVTGESMSAAIAHLETALTSDELDGVHRRRAAWCLARAHAVEGRVETSDEWLQAWLPAPVRPAFPLLASRLRALP